MVKLYRCDLSEKARLIARYGYRTPDHSIWLSKDEPMTMYGAVCFEVKLPAGTEEIHHDDEGYPIRASFKYPGDHIPPENFRAVIGEQLLIDVFEEVVIPRKLWKLSVETSRQIKRPGEETPIPIGYAQAYYGDEGSLFRFLEGQGNFDEPGDAIGDSYLDYIEVVRGRGRGLGSLILERMIAELRRRDVRELTMHLEGGDRHDKDREKFFRRFGFRMVRRQPEQPKFMRLEISSDT